MELVLGVGEVLVEKFVEEIEGFFDGESVVEKRFLEKSDDDKKLKIDFFKSVVSKVDKRKKVCSVCNKWFWLL